VRSLFEYCAIIKRVARFNVQLACKIKLLSLSF